MLQNTALSHLTTFLAAKGPKVPDPEPKHIPGQEKLTEVIGMIEEVALFALMGGLFLSVIALAIGRFGGHHVVARYGSVGLYSVLGAAVIFVGGPELIKHFVA